MTLKGLLLQATIALLVAHVDVLLLSVAVVGTPVPLGVAGAPYAVLEVGKGNTIGETAIIRCGLNGDGLSVTSRAFELVEVVFTELARMNQNFGLAWNDGKVLG